MLYFAAALFSRRLLEFWLAWLAQKTKCHIAAIGILNLWFRAIYAHLRSLSFTSTLGLAACQILMFFCHVTCTEFFPKEFTSITCCRCILGIFLTMEGLGDFHCTIWNWFIDQLFWPLVFAPGCSSFATELQDGSYVSGGKFFKLAPYQPCALSSASILTLALFAVLNSVKVVLVRSEWCVGRIAPFEASWKTSSTLARWFFFPTLALTLGFLNLGRCRWFELCADVRLHWTCPTL